MNELIRLDNLHSDLLKLIIRCCGPYCRIPISFINNKFNNLIINMEKEYTVSIRLILASQFRSYAAENEYFSLLKWACMNNAPATFSEYRSCARRNRIDMAKLTVAYGAKMDYCTCDVIVKNRYLEILNFIKERTCVSQDIRGDILKWLDMHNCECLVYRARIYG